MATNNAANYSPTQYNVQTGAASGKLNNVAPSATSGVPVISQGASAQPIFGTAVVAGGGTGNTTFTAYSVICAGTTATGTFQNVSGLGSSNQVLTSNGAGALPSWQAAGGTTVGAATFFGNVASPTALALNASTKMLGLGSTWAFTPLNHTSIYVLITYQQTLGQNLTTHQIAYGTGTAPTNGAAPTGTTVGLQTAGVNGGNITKVAVITGLSTSTAYWFDLQIGNAASQTTTMKNCEFTVYELQY